MPGVDIGEAAVVDAVDEEFLDPGAVGVMELGKPGEFLAGDGIAAFEVAVKIFKEEAVPGMVFHSEADKFLKGAFGVSALEILHAFEFAHDFPADVDGDVEIEFFLVAKKVVEGSHGEASLAGDLVGTGVGIAAALEHLPSGGDGRAEFAVAVL